MSDAAAAREELSRAIRAELAQTHAPAYSITASVRDLLALADAYADAAAEEAIGQATGEWPS